MLGRVAAAPGVELVAAGRFAGQPVGVGAVQAGGAHGLVHVHHDVVVGRVLGGAHVVVHHPLAVVVLAARDDAAHVAGFHGVVAVRLHEAVGGVQAALVVGDRAAGFVVHDELHALAGGVALQLVHVEVGVGRHEVEHFFLPVAGPVFPAHVPAFHQHALDVVLGGEVDVALHVGGVGAVAAVGLRLAQSVPASLRLLASE